MEGTWLRNYNINTVFKRNSFVVGLCVYNIKCGLKVFSRRGTDFRNNLFRSACLGLDNRINEIIYPSCGCYKVLPTNMTYCNRGFCSGFCTREDDLPR